jgi:hypothetical protein
VTLTANGILTYYDPKNIKEPKDNIDLKHKDIIVRVFGKLRDHMEILTKDIVYLFKVPNKNPLEMRPWEDSVMRFTQVV